MQLTLTNTTATPTDHQYQAIQAVASQLSTNQIAVLKGIAGSGKSFSIPFIIDALNFNPEDVLLLAPTGIAAKNIGGQTIHSFRYKPIIENDILIGFIPIELSEYEWIPKLIIVDEYSMVEQQLIDDLAILGSKILLVGDQAQLPPVSGTNNFLGVVHGQLSQPMRQALDNPILWAANLVRKGEPIPYGLHGNVLFVGRKTDLDDTWIKEEVMMICGKNATKDMLNNKITNGRDWFMDGDKVMFLQNTNQGIYNGTIVKLEGVESQRRRYGTVYRASNVGSNSFKFGEKPNKFLDSYATFAYAITCHKSQGQTFASKGLIIDESYLFREYQSNWLYTAVSRFTGQYPVALLR